MWYMVRKNMNGTVVDSDTVQADSVESAVENYLPPSLRGTFDASKVVNMGISSKYEISEDCFISVQPTTL